MCDTINSLAINSEPTDVGFAKFVDEATVCADIPATTTNHYTLQDPQDVQSIKDYLARPRMISTGDITTGVGALYSLNIRTANVIRDALTPLHYNRLRGAVGFRATLRFTLVAAATPFHQGILNLNWQYATDNVDFAGNARGNHLPLAYNLPKVLLDVADTTMVNLDVPFVSHLEYFPVDVNSEFNMYHGVVTVVKQTNFRVAVGQTTPEYSLYLSLHDIELIGAVPYTGQAVILQAGSSGGATGISELHKEIKRGKLISKTLEATAGVARVISGVPGLNIIGGTADWFLRAASKAASAFGYSKPLDENKPERYNRVTYAGDSHVDVPSQAFATTPFQTNKLAVNSALGCTDDDQMAMDYVLTKPSLIFRGQMSETDANGATIYGTYVSPYSFWYRDKELKGGVPTGNLALPNVATGTDNAIYPSTLLYVGNNFRYWRGNIKFKVTFSKCKMHGGRVQFSYFPYTSVPAANVQLGTVVFAPESAAGVLQPTGMTTIFDLRDGSSFEFVCPYMCTDPYLPVEGATGAVTMSIINQLRAPGIAASTVDYLVEVSAVEGFEFACLAPATLGAVQPGAGTINPSFQSGIVFQSGQVMVNHTDDASQNVIGEKFMSLKQLAMVPSWFVADLANNSLNRITMTPWFKYNGVPTAAPYGITINDQALWFNAPCLRVASLYSFANGGTLYQLSRDGGPTVNFTASAVQYPNTSGATYTELAGAWNRSSNSGGGVFMPETAESSRWKVPAFSRYMRVPLTQAFAALGGYQRTLTPAGIGTQNYNPAFFANRVDLLVRNSSGAARRYALGRSAADDARASQFIGPPPCSLFLATAIITPTAGGDVLQGAAPF